MMQVTGVYCFSVRILHYRCKKTGLLRVSCINSFPAVNPMPFYTVLPFLYMLYIKGHR